MLLSPNTGYHARVRRSTPPFTSLALLILIALPLAVPLLLARPGDAQEPPAEFAPYLRRTDGRPADPINVIFIGEGDAGQIAPKLTGLFRWVPVNGSSMAFVDHGQTRWAEVQLGTVADAGVRRHIRLAGAAAESARWGRYTLASVHHDLVVPCGHVGLGFDEERDALALAMRNAGYALSWVYLGNDDPVEHCNGAQTRGDGWAAVIDLRSSGTPAPSPTPAPAASPMPAPTPSPSPSPSPEPPAATPSPTPAPPAPPELPSPVEGPQPPDIRG